jgi:hypothetical protein
VASADDIRIRLQGGVELILAPPSEIPKLVLPELMTPASATSSAVELMSVLRDVAASSERLKSSLSPLRLLPTVPGAPPPSPSVKRESPAVAIFRKAEAMAADFGSPPAKRLCEYVGKHSLR